MGINVQAPNAVFRTTCRNRLLALLLGFLALAAAGGAVAYSIFGGSSGGVLGIGKPNPIAVSTTASGETIGLSDGSYAFDTKGRTDKTIKTQASDKFKGGDSVGAQNLWKQALGQDTNDAEVAIYLEDQQVRDSHKDYVILVVGTALTGSPSNIGNGRENLQGAYVAQKEFNDAARSKNSTQAILWVANAGGDLNNATKVSQQIVDAVKQDKHVVGVMGWPFSRYTLKAVDVLAKANSIPLVSSSASSDSLTGISQFFFRVVPPDTSQVVAAVKYAENGLGAHKAAVFLDRGDAYSNSLGTSFIKQFSYDSSGSVRNSVVAEESYTVGKTVDFSSLVQNALSKNPDLIYFAGYSDDMSNLLKNFPASATNVQLLGGDGLYILGGYNAEARAGFTRLHFTAFAYPDTWDILHLSSQKPAFFGLYKQAFDPHGKHTQSPYGFSRPDNDATVAYDAMLVLLQGCKNGLAATKNTLTPEALQQGIARITGNNAIQGASGQISLGINGDPVNKAVVLLYVDDQGHIKMPNEGVQGCFLLRSC